ncbi:Crp/Fnr family transcriptional regulator [Zobellia amurskyensis]|uniref:Crp/Fnr family transcriptional regulator n=1 Tax=Zobellia amurskyensis TaxID=248905 RepID=A0A7X2ZX87_9FLAO|nr:Crp/Fnr family transcriptional regulator [Zobellia amurskyensis]MUH38009.1 Crp/Fnr family transcriptional regulator [Zobellia amurskyensis]
MNTGCLIKRNLNLNGIVSEFTHEKREFTCKKGQQFIMEGAPVNGLFFILSGKVKVFRTGINGREQIVRFANSGEIIGHRGFGTQEYYSIGVMALEDTALCYFSKDNLQKVLLTAPNFTYDLMLFYANELNRSEAKVKSISQMTVRERVIDALIYIERKFGQKNKFLDIVLSRREYANYAGTTEEQVIRVFSALKKDNLIDTKGKRVQIIDSSFLKREISEHNFYLDS